MNKIKLKQGTLKWEIAKNSRIGSSEIFDIVKYFSTDEELHNCGINVEKFREEKPYTSAWALYHKMIKDGMYQRESLEPEFAEYGHAVEPYGLYVLQKERKNKLIPGEVFISDRLIASLDISGVSEEIDEIPFNYGYGIVPKGKRFVCEQKTIMPNVIKNGLPQKHIIQAQYQISVTKAHFYILQLMVLNKDTTFERGKITQMAKKKKIEYLNENMTVSHLYFQNNEHLASLINICLERFFNDVDNHIEPTPFIAYEKQKNIIDCIRINSFYNKDLILEYDLSNYLNAKKESEIAELKYKAEHQKIIEKAKECNASQFISNDGTKAYFSKDGKLLLKLPKGAENAKVKAV